MDMIRKMKTRFYFLIVKLMQSYLLGFLEMIQAGVQYVRVNQDTRLNYRVIDLRTPANQGIFHIQSEVGKVRFFISNFSIFPSLLHFNC